jgi:hypothetical protein
MVTIPLGLNDWESRDTDIARIKLSNMYLGDNPFSPDGISRFSRPSLTAFSTVGTGPIQGMWQQDGSNENNWLVVSGNSLYSFNQITKISTFLTTLTVEGFCQFAGNENYSVCVSGGRAHLIENGVVTELFLPEPGQLFQTVAQIDGSFLFGVKDTFRFYWLPYLETVIDPLNFASAEREPDPILSINIVSDEIWFIGSESVEVWSSTGDQDAPYARISGRAYTTGTFNKDSVCRSSYNGYPCLLWITNTKEVVLAQGNPKKISTDSEEELLKNATNIRCWVFLSNRCDFYVITTDQITLVYNITKNSWARWNTYLLDNWLAHLGLQEQDNVYAGSSIDNRIWILDTNEIDDNNLLIVCEVSGFVPLQGKQEPCASVNIRANVGWSTSYTVPGLLEIKWSDDGGFTFSNPRQMSMGVKAEYNKDLTFRSLGLLKRPGRLFVLSFSGLVGFRVDYATMNEV